MAKKGAGGNVTIGGLREALATDLPDNTIVVIRSQEDGVTVTTVAKSVTLEKSLIGSDDSFLVIE